MSMLFFSHTKVNPYRYQKLDFTIFSLIYYVCSQIETNIEFSWSVNMNTATLIVCLLIAIALFFAIRRIIKNKKNGKCSCGSLCGGNCKDCGNCQHCHSSDKSPRA